jgi:sugar phosphate isomerase/epimerase
MGHDVVQAHLWPEDVLREINEGKRACTRSVVDAGHGWFHEERPDAVLRAVSDLLGRVAGRPGS